MKIRSLEELKKMLPPEVVGIAGCDAFNAHRAEVWQSVDQVYRMQRPKIDRAGPGSVKGTAAEFQCFNAAAHFDVALSELKRERAALLAPKGSAK